MNIVQRTAKLKTLFSLQKPSETDDTRIEMIPQDFHQKMGEENLSFLQGNMAPTEFCALRDDTIKENTDFSYVVFNPKGLHSSRKFILLLHGLNERSWDKYLTWAEDLALNCSVPVILFPIAFHMNRTPGAWSAPRWIMPWASKRKEEISGLNNCSFFNTALSSRLSLSPERFYISGRESVYNIWQLMTEIRRGEHPLFSPECDVDIFAYSIGALLSQVLLIANPGDFFSSTRLFTFCGGSIFEKMNGNAKDIMDQDAFQTLRRYYLNTFLDSNIVGDDIERALKVMLAQGRYTSEREHFFAKAMDRIKMVLLGKDTVVPTCGAIGAVGNALSGKMISELDFPYQYTHQMPFPMTPTPYCEEATLCFRKVFDSAASFLTV